jgi:hypothetical protein
VRLAIGANRNERIRRMTRTKQTQVGSFLFMIAAGGTAFATCPNTMPMQLLIDCIVYEGDGVSSFPTSDYAYMDRYKDWLRRQPQGTILPPDTAGLPTN